MEIKLNGVDHLTELAIMLVFFFHFFITSGGKPEYFRMLLQFVVPELICFYVENIFNFI